MSKTKIEFTNRTWDAVYGCNESRLLQPLKWKGKETCIVNTAADLFHESVPFLFIDKVFASMAMADNVTFQILTKRPDRMLAYFLRQTTEARVMTECDSIGDSNPKLFQRAVDGALRVQFMWPLNNVWLGVSVENQATINERLPALLKVPAAVRFISCEPLLGSVDVSRFLNPSHWDSSGVKGGYFTLPAIDWVITGGESGRDARPIHPDWVRSLRDQCAAAGTSFLFKQWGSYMPIDQPHEQDTIRPLAKNEMWLNFEGGQGCHGNAVYRVRRATKGRTGRFLDGVLHDQFPRK